ncbi:MAG: FtsX-like permease family protein [Bacteroidetes bacterium]|jgi:putative ABC transport system permease protein|nr:FtsX-like permease family protein [Bacteroidota bacterium]
MLRNYFVVAARALRRHLGTTLINLGGLAIGIAVCLLFGTLAWTLLTWDHFHPEVDRLHLVHADMKTAGGWERANDTWGPTLRDLTQTFPAIETGTRLWSVGQRVSPDRTADDERGARAFEESVDYVDSTFFQVMGFTLKEGDPADVLDRPNAAVITENKARAYFGDANPIGKTLTLDGQSTVTVTGLAHNPPANTTMQPDVVVNIAHARIHNVEDIRGALDQWSGSFLNTYVRLEDGTDPNQLEAQFGDFLAQQIGPEDAEQRRMGLIGIADIADEWDDAYIYAYLVIALAFGILGLAAINVTNLATARSLERVQEIGVRKAMGARREGLAVQFLLEAQLLAFGALVLGVTIGQMLLPAFGAFVDMNMRLDWTDLRLWAALGGLGVLVGVLAGGYPALVLSRFKPATALRGSLTARPGGQHLRRGLVAGQFALALLLVAGTFGIQKQIAFMQDRVSNLHLDAITWVPVRSDLFDDPVEGRQQLATLQQELQRSSAVAAASVSSVVPGRYYIGNTFRKPGAGNAAYVMRTAAVDASYFSAYDLQITAGHGFEAATEAERDAGIVVNQATMRAMGWDTIDGKALFGGTKSAERHPVIGVVEDFHFKSLRDPIEPAVHFYAGADATNYRYVSVRAAGPIDDAIQVTRTVWEAIGISVPFDYRVAGDQFSGVGNIDQKLGTLVSYAALLALIVAAMGLFGIASLMVAQRTKEIGVRKALGASVTRIVWLFSAQLTRLVLVATVVALPLAYWGVQQWLQDFAYRVDLPGWTFALAGGAVLAVALLTVSGQVVRAARLTPATTLRDE